MKLYDRLFIAKQREVAFPSAHVIVFNDPARGDGVATQVLIPDHNFMAAAMAGGYLPEVSAYHQTEYKVTLSDDKEYNGMGFHEFDDFILELVGSGKSLKSQVVTKYTVHDAPIMDAMTELEAIEYLKMKDIPKRIWGDSSRNFPRYQVCKYNSLPTSRIGRNHWNMTGDHNNPISVDLEATKTEFTGKLINRFILLQKNIEAKRPFAECHETTNNEIKAFDKLKMSEILLNVSNSNNIQQLERAIPALLQ